MCNRMNFTMCWGLKENSEAVKTPSQHGFFLMKYGFKYILVRKQKDEPSSITYQVLRQSGFPI